MHFFRAIFGGTTQIGVKQYRSKFYGHNDHVLLDIRNKKEFAMEHMEGAINIPLNKLRKRLDDVPQGQTIVCVSRTGERGREAVHFLQEHGYEDVINLMGGTLAWKQTGGRVVRD